MPDCDQPAACKSAMSDFQFIRHYQDAIKTSQQHPAIDSKHNPDMDHISDRMKAERRRLGLTQEDLAAKAKISQSFIGALESRNQESSSWIPEIANALGVSAYWLKTGKGQHLTGSPVDLSEQQRTLISAWSLIDPDTLDSWVALARKKLEHQHAIDRDVA